MHYLYSTKRSWIVNICFFHQLGGPVGKSDLVPPSARAVLKIETPDTVFPNSDRPKLVNNIFIFLKVNKMPKEPELCNYSKISLKLKNILAV